MLNANPYRNFDYKVSPWQTMLSHLGFRTSADAYKESMSLQAAEYDAEVLNKIKNEEFESPLAEAQRMRAAGQNPDLLGTGDVNGASAPDLKDDNPPVSPTGDVEDLAAAAAPVLQFANTCMSALTTGMAIAKDFGSLINMGIMNRAGEIQNVTKVAEFADWIGQNFYKSPDLWESLSFDPETGEPVPEKLVAVGDYFDQFGKNIPRKYQKQFERNLQTSLLSFKGANTRYDEAVRYLTNKEKYNLLRGKPTFANGMSDQAIMDVLEPLSKLLLKLRNLRFKCKKV